MTDDATSGPARRGGQGDEGGRSGSEGFGGFGRVPEERGEGKRDEGKPAAAAGRDPVTGEPAKGPASALGGETVAGRDAGPVSGTRAPRAGHETGRGAPLLPHDESDKLSLRLQHAVTGFVDGPRDSVEEADHVLEEVAARFADVVNQRRRTLRRSWQEDEGKGVTSPDTEQLRLALRDYREITERLLRL